MIALMRSSLDATPGDVNALCAGFLTGARQMHLRHSSQNHQKQRILAITRIFDDRVC